jgi:hypothetical protein
MSSSALASRSSVPRLVPRSAPIAVTGVPRSISRKRTKHPRAHSTGWGGYRSLELGFLNDRFVPKAEISGYPLSPMSG